MKCQGVALEEVALELQSRAKIRSSSNLKELEKISSLLASITVQEKCEYHQVNAPDKSCAMGRCKVMLKYLQFVIQLLV